MATLLQSLVAKAESAEENFAADVRAVIIKAHEELDAIFARDKSVVEKEETKVEADIDAAPKTEAAPAPTSVVDTPPAVTAENEVGNGSTAPAPNTETSAAVTAE